MGVQAVRSVFGVVLSGAVALAALAGLVAIALADGGGALLRALPVAALVVLLVAAGYALPVLRLDDAGVVVRNVWSTTVVPWGACRGARVRFGLEVLTDGRPVAVWAVPRSAWAVRARGGDEQEAAAGAERAVVEGCATHPDAPPAAVTRRWHAGLLAAVPALAVASAVALLVG